MRGRWARAIRFGPLLERQCAHQPKSVVVHVVWQGPQGWGGASFNALNFVERSPNLRRLRIKGILMGNLRISASEAKTKPKLRMAVNKM